MVFLATLSHSPSPPPSHWHHAGSPKRNAVADVYILLARSTDISAHIATRGRILFVQVHFLTALRALHPLPLPFSIAANDRSIFSASARSAGCSLANPPAARTFSNMRSFSAADPCTSRISVMAMLLRFGSFRFRNIAIPVDQNWQLPGSQCTVGPTRPKHHVCDNKDKHYCVSNGNIPFPSTATSSSCVRPVTNGAPKQCLPPWRSPRAHARVFWVIAPQDRQR